jgi:DNA/RNA endonuclease G (NUC1)
MRAYLGWLVAIFVSSTSVAQEAGFGNCAAAFPGGTIAGATVSTSGSAAATRMDLCYRNGTTPFFAVKYNTTRRLPDWVAYRVSDTFGAERCSSLDREAMGCYFRGDDTKACVTEARGSDPFHIDVLLAKEKKPRLHTQIYSGSGHDRGHMAPNNAFSWHLCGAWQTFSMANMAPQVAFVNRTPWAALEAQELFWGVTAGPVVVITGPIFARFPANAFKVFTSGQMDQSQVDTPGTVLPKHDPADPEVPSPTGFFKVIFKPAAGSQPARAIGFLLPHTTESDFGFWEFMVRIDLIERVAGLKFAIPEQTKDGMNTAFWTGRKVPGDWSVRAEDCRTFTPQGFDKTIRGAEARANACIAAGTN